MSKVKWTSDALLSTATIDLRTAREGARTHPLRLQAEFPHVNRMVSLTNASVIPSLLFVVVLDFRS